MCVENCVAPTAISQYAWRDEWWTTSTGSRTRSVDTACTVLGVPAVPPTPYTLHPEPYALHLPPCTLHPTPYTLHPTPSTLRNTPDTLHPTSKPKPKPTPLNLTLHNPTYTRRPVLPSCPSPGPRQPCQADHYQLCIHSWYHYQLCIHSWQSGHLITYI